MSFSCFFKCIRNGEGASFRVVEGDESFRSHKGIDKKDNTKNTAASHYAKISFEEEHLSQINSGKQSDINSEPIKYFIEGHNGKTDSNKFQHFRSSDPLGILCENLYLAGNISTLGIIGTFNDISDSQLNLLRNISDATFHIDAGDDYFNENIYSLLNIMSFDVLIIEETSSKFDNEKFMTFLTFLKKKIKVIVLVQKIKDKESHYTLDNISNILSTSSSKINCECFFSKIYCFTIISIANLDNRLKKKTIGVFEKISLQLKTSEESFTKPLLLITPSSGDIFSVLEFYSIESQCSNRYFPKDLQLEVEGKRDEHKVKKMKKVNSFFNTKIDKNDLETKVSLRIRSNSIKNL